MVPMSHVFGARVRVPRGRVGVPIGTVLTGRVGFL